MNENSIIVNLCVEVWDYYPVAFKQISSVIATFLKEEKKGIKSDESENCRINVGKESDA